MNAPELGRTALETSSTAPFPPAQRPLLVLAPMQDVTDLPFMQLMHHYGGPDLYVTEYFRVTPDSKLNSTILRSITENHTGKPVLAQLIGQDIPALVRSAKELQSYPIAGIDLNLGCPAPVVCRKDAGGGLLRDPGRIHDILTALRAAITTPFTVKCRVGFHHPDEFQRLLDLFASHDLQMLTIHARTVKEAYKTPVHPDCVARAVQQLPFPVIANGNVVDVATGQAYLQQTQAAGLMIGRGAIRRPWLFQQLRAHQRGEQPMQPRRRDLLEYIHLLYQRTAAFQGACPRAKHVQKMKRYLVYIAHGLDEGQFEHRIRRVTSEEDFFSVCAQHLDDDSPLPERPPADSGLFCGFSQLSEASL